MNKDVFDSLISSLKGKTVERPNKAGHGTLSGHAAGEPFEKLVYRILKDRFPNNVYKQFEYLNDLFYRNPRCITKEDRSALFDSPVALFLLSRGDKAIREWRPENVFEEKQDDTADVLWHQDGVFDVIDVKTCNAAKKAMPPNIISAYKLARACALMIDNNDFSSVDIHYVEVEWEEQGDSLICTDAYWRDLFKCLPERLYINWAAAMQIQFHVSGLDQDFSGSKEQWARLYIRNFVDSAEARCNKMYETYVRPFMKYIGEARQP